MSSKMDKFIERFAVITDPEKSIFLGDPNSKLAVVLVHGAWHIPEHYRPLLQSLSNSGYFVACPLLPTCNDARPPTKTIEDDVQTIRDVLDVLTNADKDILMITHSYGGLIGSLAATRESNANTSNGSKPTSRGLFALVYMCAFIVFEDLSLADQLPGGLPVWIKPEDDGTLSLVDPDKHFYHDLSLDEQRNLTSMLVRHPISAQLTKLPKVNYDGLKLAYLICTEDRALLPENQRSRIQSIIDKGYKVQVGECSASHSPFRSMPEKVVDFVKEIIKSA